VNNFEPSSTLNAYVPSSIIIPDDWSLARNIMTDYILAEADAINVREIAQYDTRNLITGQQWFVSGDANKFRYGFRRVVDIGGLNDYSGGTTTQTVAHNITTNENMVFTHIYGCATDPGASTVTAAMPIPYVDADAVANSIEVWVDATNVNLRYGADYSAFTTAYVVLEWLQNPG